MSIKIVINSTQNFLGGGGGGGACPQSPLLEKGLVAPFTALGKSLTC